MNLRSLKLAHIVRLGERKVIILYVMKVLEGSQIFTQIQFCETFMGTDSIPKFDEICPNQDQGFPIFCGSLLLCLRRNVS